MSKPRKPIAELIEELRSWLPNYDHGPDSFPNTFYRIIASLPGGEELEDIGYEPMPGIGWHEADLLGRVLVEIQGKHDVEDLVAGLVHEEGEEVEEARSNPVEHKMTRREAETAWRRGNNNGEGYAPYTDIPGDDTIDNAVAAAEADGWTVIYPRNNTDQIVVLRNEDGEWMGIGGDASDQGAWAVSLTPGPGVKVRESAVRHDRRHRVKWNQNKDGNAWVSDGAEGYWAHFPPGTSAKEVLDVFMETADYSNSTITFTVRAEIDGDVAEVRVEPGGRVRPTTTRRPLRGR